MDWERREELKRVIAEGVEEGVGRVLWWYIMVPVVGWGLISWLWPIIQRLPWDGIQLIFGALLMSLFVFGWVIGIVQKWRHPLTKWIDVRFGTDLSGTCKGKKKTSSPSS